MEQLEQPIVSVAALVLFDRAKLAALEAPDAIVTCIAL